MFTGDLVVPRPLLIRALVRRLKYAVQAREKSFPRWYADSNGAFEKIKPVSCSLRR